VRHGRVERNTHPPGELVRRHLQNIYEKRGLLE
jgi:hypothetical protein